MRRSGGGGGGGHVVVLGLIPIGFEVGRSGGEGRVINRREE